MHNIIITSGRQGGASLIAEQVFSKPQANRQYIDLFQIAVDEQRAKQRVRGFVRQFETPFQLSSDMGVDTIVDIINTAYVEDTSTPWHCFAGGPQLIFLFEEINNAIPGLTWIVSKRDVAASLEKMQKFGIPLNTSTTSTAVNTFKDSATSNIIEIIDALDLAVSTSGAQWMYIDAKNPIDQSGNLIPLTEYDPNNANHIEAAIIRM